MPHNITHFIARRLRQAPPKAFTRMAHQIGVVSIAIGLATTLVAFSIMAGFQQQLTHQLMGLAGHLQIVKYSSNRSYEEPPIERAKLQGLQEAFADTVEEAKAFAHKAVLLQAADEIEGVVCKGLDPAAQHNNLKGYLRAGRLLNLSSEVYSQEVLLSMRTAARLRVQVGDEVLASVVQHPPRYRKLRVVGLYATHIEDVDERLAFCDLRLIQRLNQWPDSWVGGYEVFLKDHDVTQAVAERLRAWLDYDLGLRATEAEHADLFDWLGLVRKNAQLLMALILIVMSTNLASLVLIQMMERTPMLATLKVLGASERQLVLIMLWNNLSMLAQGMFWGNCLGLGLCALQHYTQLIALDPVYYHIDHVPIAWGWRMVLALNLLTLSVALTALFGSIALIVRQRPLHALKSIALILGLTVIYPT